MLLSVAEVFNSFLMPDLSFSRLWRFKSSSGLYDAVWCYGSIPTIHPEDGGRILLRNVDKLLQHYTVSEPKRPRHDFRLFTYNIFVSYS